MELVDAAGSKIIRQTNPKTFKANTRSGVNVVWDDATVNIDDKPLTWYDDYAKNGFSDMGANSVYVKGAKIRGVGIESVKVIGVRLRKLTDDGQETGDENITYHPNSDLSSLSSDENGTLSFDSQLDNIPSGNYYVRPYAIIINSDGAEQEIISTVHTAIVTSIPTITSHTIRSSYNNNGAVTKTNELDGDKIYAAASIDDAFVANNLIESATLHYGGNTLTIDAKGTQFPTGNIAYQQYSDCYAEIVLKNKYPLTTQSYTVNVTGIPYSINFTDGSPAGWATNNTSKYDNYLQLVHGTAWIISPRFIVPETCDITTTINAGAYRTTGTYNPNIYISISNIGEAGGTPTKLNGENALNMSYQDISRDLQIGIEDNNSHICIYSSGNKPNWATNNTGIAVKTCNVKYK